ncbi:DUF4873 domain-containing protein [Nocardioides kongjuensis]|uniref:DUF4873 domain-containing protein n=1 Tax=Nocardioides kongjuensis TaxID=349522 RepID=A0A852S4Y3_9ACTN|nr:hypothetical protein [Nocardioides kongjuensis]
MSAARPELHEPQEAYDGPAVLVVAGTAGTAGRPVEHPVSVTLRGAFQPLDGHFHWYGRIAVDAALDTVRSGSAVTLRTAHGEADGKVADVDPWGRFRVSGTGRPPF